MKQCYSNSGSGKNEEIIMMYHPCIASRPRGGVMCFVFGHDPSCDPTNEAARRHLLAFVQPPHEVPRDAGHGPSVCVGSLQVASLSSWPWVRSGWL